MSTEAERQSANIIPPTQSATPGVGVTLLAATTTAAAAAIPESLHNQYVYLQAEGDKIWVAFGPAASPDISKATSGQSTFAAGTATGCAVPIPDGQRIPVRIDRVRHAFIKWQAATTSSKLIVYPTTPPSTAYGA